MSDSRPIEIDGREGEGGGQIVRTSVALAAILGRPLRLIRVRANRKKPGLQAQHLTAVKAVATVCQAQTEGLRLGAERFRFVPGALRGGHFEFSVPTAGSAGLVMQAILPVLLRAPSPSEVILQGGTHVRAAPSFDHSAQALLPALRAMGANVTLRLERSGFYPKGGGRMVLNVEPWSGARRFEATTPPEDWSVRARVYVGRLPDHVETRARGKLKQLGFSVEDTPGLQPSPGPGLACALLLTSAVGTDVVTGLGEKGTPTEAVMGDTADVARGFQLAGVPVGPHLADQLLVYLALGAGGRFLTVQPTLHFETQISTLEKFLGERIEVRDQKESVLVEVTGAGVVPLR